VIPLGLLMIHSSLLQQFVDFAPSQTATVLVVASTNVLVSIAIGVVFVEFQNVLLPKLDIVGVERGVLVVLLLIILGGVIVGRDGDEIHARNDPPSQSHRQQELVPIAGVPVLLSVDQLGAGVGGCGGGGVPDSAVR